MYSSNRQGLSLSLRLPRRTSRSSAVSEAYVFSHALFSCLAYHLFSVAIQKAGIWSAVLAIISVAFVGESGDRRGLLGASVASLGVSVASL